MCSVAMLCVLFVVSNPGNFELLFHSVDLIAPSIWAGQKRVYLTYVYDVLQTGRASDKVTIYVEERCGRLKGTYPEDLMAGGQ